MTDSLHNLPHPLLAPVIELTRLAGEVILPFWRANVTVTTKT
ncbi:3'(2'),5'-bisphosphate nucleotidase CysQ, partial [Pseudomonas syringae]|nr:3'(2'),5'-bisphosphate nucleotidase CysQ [Pseudomonas syringae]